MKKINIDPMAIIVFLFLVGVILIAICTRCAPETHTEMRLITPVDSIDAVEYLTYGFFKITEHGDTIHRSYTRIKKDEMLNENSNMLMYLYDIRKQRVGD